MWPGPQPILQKPRIFSYSDCFIDKILINLIEKEVSTENLLLNFMLICCRNVKEISRRFKMSSYFTQYNSSLKIQIKTTRGALKPWSVHLSLNQPSCIIRLKKHWGLWRRWANQTKAPFVQVNKSRNKQLNKLTTAGRDSWVLWTFLLSERGGTSRALPEEEPPVWTFYNWAR